MAGFAACFDPEVAGQFAKDASREYRALGITTALGPQIDLCTEPRWMRFVDTLGEEVEMSKKLTKAYCDGMQTTEGEADGWGKDSVNTMVKHWPGGDPDRQTLRRHRRGRTRCTLCIRTVCRLSDRKF